MDFDLIVIGSGSTGAQVAQACRKKGWKVAIAEERRVGGTCMLRGCTPKKVLFRISELIERFDGFKRENVLDGHIHLAWADLQKWKNEKFIDAYASSRLEGLNEAGIEILEGRASFLSKNELQIGKKSHSAKHICIASGAKPRDLEFEGHEHLVTSDVFLDQESLPKKILFVGGGYVSFELAHIAKRLGSSVTIIDRGACPLKQFDPDLVRRLVKHSRELGIDIRTKTDVEAVSKTSEMFDVKVKSDAKGEVLSAQQIVHGAGRVPNLGGLNLEKAGIEYSDEGIETNAYLQCRGNTNVYAGGDVVHIGEALTPVASIHGSIISSNLLNEDKREFRQELIPSAVFTIPPMASVGLSEKEAKSKIGKLDVREHDLSSWFSVRQEAERSGGAKILIDGASEIIVGAHVFHPQAADIINLFTLAMEARMKISDLKDCLLAYPTATSDFKSML